MDFGLPDRIDSNTDATFEGHNQMEQRQDSDVESRDSSRVSLREMEDYTRPTEEPALRALTVLDTTSEKSYSMKYWNKAAVNRDGLEIRAPPIREPWQYVVYDKPEISEVLQEYSDEGSVSYLVRFTDGRVEEVSPKTFNRPQFV